MQKQVITQVILTYLAEAFDMKHLVVATYINKNMMSHQQEPRCEFYMHPPKVISVEKKHSITISDIFTMLFDKKEYILVGKLRDKLHEKKAFLCLDDIMRRETRWSMFFLDIEQILTKLVFNLRVHEKTGRPVIGFITAFSVEEDIIRNTPIYANCVKGVRRLNNKHKDPMSGILERFLGHDIIEEEPYWMKYKKTSTGEIVDLTEQQLYELPTIEDVKDLEPYMDDSGEAAMYKRASLRSYHDTKKMLYYYPEDDKEHDPDGMLYEHYVGTFFAEPINEDNLLKYSKYNADIYNELLDQKYEEFGGWRKMPRDYTRTKWPEFGPLYRSLGYGYDQPIIYENMCAAFGKDKVDRVWRKHYKYFHDDGLDGLVL